MRHPMLDGKEFKLSNKLISSCLRATRLPNHSGKHSSFGQALIFNFSRDLGSLGISAIFGQFLIVKYLSLGNRACLVGVSDSGSDGDPRKFMHVLTSISRR